jgi:hypothetical protein
MRKALGDEWVEEGQRARLNRVVEAREAVDYAGESRMTASLPLIATTLMASSFIVDGPP